MKNLKYIVFSVLIFAGLITQAQAPLQGNHMACGSFSEYFILHDATQNCTADASCWSITGGTIVETFNDYTHIKVAWDPTATIKKVELNKYYPNEHTTVSYLRSNRPTITVLPCGTTAFVTYSKVSEIPGNTTIINNRAFNLDGLVFNTGQEQFEFSNCHIFMNEEAVIDIASHISYCRFKNCSFIMNDGCRIDINSLNGEIIFDECSFENNLNTKWEGIKVCSNGNPGIHIKNSYITGAKKSFQQLNHATTTLEKNVFGRNTTAVHTDISSRGIVNITSNWFPNIYDSDIFRSGTWGLGYLSCNPSYSFEAHINNNIIINRQLSITDIPSVEVKGNKIMNGVLNFLTATRSANPSPCTIAISENDIKNTYMCLNITGYNSNIYDNIINNTTSRNSSDYAIRITNDKPNLTSNIFNNTINTISSEAAIFVSNNPTSTPNSESVSIYDNYITVNQSIAPSNQGFYSAINVKGLSSSATVNILRNDIDMRPSNLHKTNGIFIENCLGNNTVEDNDITTYPYSNASTFNHKGISITSSPVNVRLNFTRGLGCGLYIKGDCHASTVKCNTFVLNEYGIYLDQARIQTQGSSVAGKASGNLWCGVNNKISGTVTEQSNWYWSETVNSIICRFSGAWVPGPTMTYDPEINNQACTSPCIRAYQGPTSNTSNCCPGTLYKKSSDDTEIQAEQETESFNIFPNPANDLLTIESNGTEAYFTLFDMSARSVLTSELNGNSTSLSLSQLKPGIYVYQITDKQGNILKTEKLSIIR